MAELRCRGPNIQKMHSVPIQATPKPLGVWFASVPDLPICCFHPRWAMTSVKHTEVPRQDTGLNGSHGP